jgi:hypothetical protein
MKVWIGAVALACVPLLGGCTASSDTTLSRDMLGSSPSTTQVTGQVLVTIPRPCGLCVGGASKPTASPVAHALVTLKSRTGGAITTAQTDSSGAFTMTVVQGSYTVEAECRGAGLDGGRTPESPVFASGGTVTPTRLDCPYAGPAPG